MDGFYKKRKTPYVTCFLCGKLYHDPEEELMHRISVVPKGAEKIWSRLVGKDLKPGSKLCQVHFEKDAFATNVEKNPYVKGPPKVCNTAQLYKLFINVYISLNRKQ